MDALLLLLLLLPVASSQNFCPPEERDRYNTRWRKTVEQKAYYRISHLIENYIKEKWRVWAGFEYNYVKGVEYNLPKCSNAMAPCKPCKCSEVPLGQWKNYPQLAPSQILPVVSGKITCGNLKFSDSIFSKQLMESLSAKNQRCPEKKVWDCSTDCATACYCSNCKADSTCCNYQTYGERLDCLFLMQHTGPRPGYASTRVKVGNNRDTRVIDLPSGVKPLIPPVGLLLKNATDDDDDDKNTLASGVTTPPLAILKLLRPLPALDTRDVKKSEAFYKNFAREIAKEKKKEEKRVRKLLTALKKEWRMISIRNEVLERRIALLQALRKRDELVANRLEYLHRQKKIEKTAQERVKQDQKISTAEKKRLDEEAKMLDIINVARNMRRRVTFLECRTLVQQQGKCFESVTACVTFVQRRCVQSRYRRVYVNQLLCASVSC